MDIVQATFQASFDSRVDRLSDGDLADLRVIFRYFDTDGDGAVAADQACRMFALLGLDVNEAQVQELGEVYLNEFMKIVDSHVTPPPPVASEAPEAGEPVEGTAQPAVPEGGAAPAPEVRPVDEVALQQHNERVLEDEWKLVDSYRRGRVSMQELQQFLANCRSTLSEGDLERFLETYGVLTGDNDHEVLELTKEGFLKFRHEYTPKKMALSDDDLSTDDEEDGIATTMQTRATSAAANTTSPTTGGDSVTMRAPSRHGERGPSEDSSTSDHLFSAREHEFVVNPDELVESDEGEDSGEETTHTANDILVN